MERLIAEPVGRVICEQGPDRRRFPAALLDRFTSSGLLRCFARLDSATGDFPPPSVGDEPMPPHQENSTFVGHDHAGGLGGHAHDVVIDATVARNLNVDDAEIHPSARVDRSFTVDMPFHREGA